MKTLSMHPIIAKLLAGCVLLLLLLSLTMVSTRTASAATTAATTLTCGSWNIVSSPNPSTDYNMLQGVAAVSASNVWAVGYEANSSTGITQTLTERWNGTTWKVIASPSVGTGNNELTGVAAVSASDAWAVGTSQTSSGTSQTLIEQWNGTSWSVIPSPNAGSSSSLTAVTAVSATDVWAVGSYQNSNGDSQSLTEQWNGTSWNIVASPTTTSGFNILSSVVAISASNVWAVGTGSSSSSGEQTLTEHWNGTSWKIVASPNNPGASINYLNGVTRVPASKTLWAVGGYYDGSHYEPLLEQWSGTAWNIVSASTAGPNDNYLYSIAAVSASDIWTVGDYTNSNSGNNLTLVEQWNGSAWNVVSSPNTGSSSNYFLAVARVPGSSNLWTVGNYQAPNAFETLTASYC